MDSFADSGSMDPPRLKNGDENRSKYTANYALKFLVVRLATV
jgi:hypothetical protein